MSTTNGTPDLTVDDLDRLTKVADPELRVISAPDLMRRQFAPIRWAVPGLITEGVTLLSGRPKMGKSWICLDLGIAVASGGMVMGSIHVDPGDVLYCALEDGQRRLQERLKRLLTYEQPTPERLHFATNWERLDDGGIDALEDWRNQHPDTRLIILDTYAKIRPTPRAGGQLYQEDYSSLDPLGTWSRSNHIGVLVVHHSRKAGADDVMDDISGSTGLSGTVDGLMVLRRARGEAEAELHVTNRDAPDQELALRWDSDGTRWSIAGSAEDSRINQEHKRILNLIAASADGLTPKEVSDRLEGANEATIRKTLRRMLEKGQIRMSDQRYVIPTASVA